MKILNLFCCLLPMWAMAQFSSVKEIQYPLNYVSTDVIELPDGDLMISGAAFPSTYDSTIALLMRTDAQLQLKWIKRYKVLKGDDFNSLNLLNDGNILAGGAMRQQFSLDEGSSLYKLDTAGNVIWQNMYERTGDDRVLRVFERPSGTLDVFVRHGVSNRPTKILEVSSTGTLNSQKTIYNTPNVGVFAESVLHENGTFYMSGNLYNADSNRTGFFMLVRTNSAVQDYKAYDLGKNGSCYTSCLLPDGNVLIGGSIADAPSSFYNNVWLMKLTPQGNVVWAKEYAGTPNLNELMSEVIAEPSGNIKLFGRVLSDTNSRSFVATLNANGNVLQSNQYQFNQYTGIQMAKRLGDGRYLMSIYNIQGQPKLAIADSNGQLACGNVPYNLQEMPLTPFVQPKTHSFDNPGVTQKSFPETVTAQNLTLTTNCSGFISLPEYTVKQEPIAYPNPFTNEIYIAFFKNEIPQKITLYNMQGKAFNMPIVISDRKITCQVGNLPAGIYAVEITSTKNTYVQKLSKL